MPHNSLFWPLGNTSTCQPEAMGMTLSNYTQNTSGQVTNFYSYALRAPYEFFRRHKYSEMNSPIYLSLLRNTWPILVRRTPFPFARSMNAAQWGHYGAHVSSKTVADAVCKFPHCRPSAAKAVSASSLWHAAASGLGQAPVGMANEPRATIKSGHSIEAKWREGVAGWAMSLNMHNILNLKLISDSIIWMLSNGNKRSHILN